METTGHHQEETSPGRPREVPAGDEVLRQLRQRYESLRRDYEQLLDRVGEIEEIVIEPASPSLAPGARLEQAITEPLLNLRDDYTGAAARIQGIIAGLERLASGSMKAQHGPTAPAAASAPAPQPEPAARRDRAEVPPEPGVRPQKVNLEVHGQGFGELLDFQEKLSSVPGVSRVSINAIDADRASLVVELRREE